MYQGIEATTARARAAPNKYFPALGCFWADVSICFMALLYIGVEYGAIYNGQPRLGDAESGASVAGGTSWTIPIFDLFPDRSKYC